MGGKGALCGVQTERGSREKAGVMIQGSQVEGAQWPEPQWYRRRVRSGWILALFEGGPTVFAGGNRACAEALQQDLHEEKKQ